MFRIGILPLETETLNHTGAGQLCTSRAKQRFGADQRGWRDEGREERAMAEAKR